VRLQFFLCCILYKFDALTATDDLQEKMSLEQRNDYILPSVLLSLLIVLSVFSALGLSVLLVMMQLAKTRRAEKHMRLAMSAEASERREIRAVLNQLGDDDRRAILQKALDIRDDYDPTHDNDWAAANHVFGPQGLDPIYWGVSKDQLIEFGREVRAALHRGEIKGQPDENKPYYYPQWKFDDPKIGPNMHQVTDPLIVVRST
jgi:hypothetical protein